MMSAGRGTELKLNRVVAVGCGEGLWIGLIVLAVVVRMRPLSHLQPGRLRLPRITLQYSPSSYVPCHAA